jgi:hypothetical protein
MEPEHSFGNPIGYGLELANVSAIRYLQGFARTIPTGPNPCNFTGDSAGDIGTDGSMVLAYVDTIGTDQTATVTYRRL